MKYFFIITICSFSFLIPLHSFGQLYLQNGAILSCNNNAVICLQNTDLINNGTINHQAGNGKFVFTGNTNNYIDGTSICTFDELDIQKSNSNSLLLKQDLNIISSIQFTTGLIDLNGKNIFLQQPTGILANENESSHITGLSGGGVHISNNSVNAPTQYNIGNLGAAITSAQNLGNLSVVRSHVPVTTGTSSGIQRMFLISPNNNSSLNATFRFYYLDAELNGKDENTLGLWKSTDGNTWDFAGADNRDATNNYVEKNSIADFSYWTLSDALNPLPLTLISFSATCENNDAMLQWETANEEDLSEFIIEKSSDAGHWDAIGNVAAQNSVSGATYHWQDKNTLGHIFYRLKIVSNNNSISYSPVFSGGCNDLSIPFIVYPNPSENIATARVSVRQDAKAQIMVMNINGQILELCDWYLKTGVNTFNLSNISKLVSGTYIISLLYNGSSFQQKLIKK
ncbi:MAG: T9SS type A sorting domain-containing protein [Bacteroidetes bacterium]|nr:T9SS type A sorting domain-containing protein [Bacteroidota bacterium]